MKNTEKEYTDEELKKLFGDFKLERGKEEREWILISKNKKVLLCDSGNGWYRIIKELDAGE